MARDCPDCSKPVDGFACRACGWRDVTAPRGDPLRYLCAHDDRGMRCGALGTFTSNTGGDGKGGPHPGPWWCFDHYPRFVNWNRGERVPPPGGFERLKALFSGIKAGE